MSAPAVPAARSQPPDEVARGDGGARPHGPDDRLVGGAQSAGVGHHHDRLTRHRPRDRDRASGHRAHRVARAGGEVDAAVPRLPVVGWGVEPAEDHRLVDGPGRRGERGRDGEDEGGDPHGASLGRAGDRRGSPLAAWGP